MQRNKQSDEQQVFKQAKQNMTLLPTDCWIGIATFLHTLEDLKNVALTSKPMYNVLFCQNIGNIWKSRHIQLLHNNGQAQGQHFDAILANIQMATISCANFADVGNPQKQYEADELNEDLFAKMRALKCLKLKECVFANQIPVFAHLRVLKLYCVQAHVATGVEFPQVTYLKFTTGKVTMNLVAKCAFPKLKTCYVENCDMFSHVQFVQQCFPTLVHLKMSSRLSDLVLASPGVTFPFAKSCMIKLTLSQMSLDDSKAYLQSLVPHLTTTTTRVDADKNTIVMKKMK